MATLRSSRVSRARYTSPIPPAPSAERISYDARRVPTDKDMSSGLILVLGVRVGQRTDDTQRVIEPVRRHCQQMRAPPGKECFVEEHAEKLERGAEVAWAAGRRRGLSPDSRGRAGRRRLAVLQGQSGEAVRKREDDVGALDRQQLAF